MIPVREIQFDGLCPFLTCLEEGPHSHPVCPTCGAVRYGNICCPECRSHEPERRAEMDQTIRKLKQLKGGQG